MEAARARGEAVVRVSFETDADVVGNRVWVDATGDAAIEIDRIVAFRPAALVLDDLGRANEDGARHRWRWQDVNDLLDAGIDVLAILDVADLASLSDITEAITGKPAEPTVPDEICHDSRMLLRLGSARKADPPRRGQPLASRNCARRDPR